MVKKLHDTANEVLDEFQTRVPKDLQGFSIPLPFFHYKKLSHKKKKKKKKFNLSSDLSNLQTFYNRSKEYRVPFDDIISIKRNIRIIRFKKFDS